MNSFYVKASCYLMRSVLLILLGTSFSNKLGIFLATLRFPCIFKDKGLVDTINFEISEILKHFKSAFHQI